MLTFSEVLVRPFPSVVAFLLALTCLGCAANSPPPQSPDASSPSDGTASAPPSDSTSTTQPTNSADPALRAASVFVVHQVSDFDAYLKQFKGNAQAREQVGVTRVLMARLADDAQRVAVHFEVPSLKTAEDFLASDEYQQLVKADQATDSTLLWTATDELVELPADVPSASVSLFKKFPVRDMECLVRLLVAGQKELHDQGLLGFSLHRSSSDENVAIVHLLAPSRATAETIYSGAPLKDAFSTCGATDVVHPIIGNNQTDL